MKYTGRIVGMLVIMCAFSFEFIHYYIMEGRFYNLISWIALVPFSYLGWWLGEQYDEVKHASVQDTLTHVYNRRYLYDRFPKLAARARRGKYKLECCVIDINNFKSINDTYGHHAGDVVLRNIARALQSLTKDGDIIVRWGGDEFVILAKYRHDRERIQAVKVDELMADLSARMKQNITVSFGRAVYTREIDDLGDLVRMADQIMYEQKSSCPARSIS